MLPYQVFGLTAQFSQNILPPGTCMAYSVTSFTSLVNVSISERNCLTTLANKIVPIHAVQYFLNPDIDFFRAFSTQLYTIYFFACLYPVFSYFIKNSRNTKIFVCLVYDCVLAPKKYTWNIRYSINICWIDECKHLPLFWAAYIAASYLLEYVRSGHSFAQNVPVMFHLIQSEN